MLTVLGTALGFGTSFMPLVLEFFEKKQDHKHRLEELRLQNEMAATRAKYDTQKLDQQTDIVETKALYGYANPTSGFVAGLSASVRPVITYCFFALYMAGKAVILLKVMEGGADWKEAVPLMEDDQFKFLFSAIMSFWFGKRMAVKYQDWKANK